MSSTSPQLDTFYLQYPTQEIAASTVLIQSDELTPSFYYLESGSVRMSSTSATGQHIPLHVFYPGSCFSLLSLIPNPPSELEFTTVTKVSVRKIPRQDFIDLLQNDAQISYSFMINVLSGSSGLLKRIEQNVSANAHQQVAGLLLYFWKHHPELSNISEKTVKITHQEIADWLGLSRESVTLQMSKLTKAGVIGRHENLLTILDTSTLQKIAEDMADL